MLLEILQTYIKGATSLAGIYILLIHDLVYSVVFERGISKRYKETGVELGESDFE